MADWAPPASDLRGWTPPATDSGSPPQPWYQKALHGFEAPMVGADLLAAQAENAALHLPGGPASWGKLGEAAAKTATNDLSLAEQEKKAFEAQGSPHFSMWEMLGNMASPLNYLMGGAAPGAGLAKVIGRAALSGAGSTLVQPKHSPGDLAAGAASGAVLGATAEPLVRAISGNTVAGLDKFIKENFTRSVKPGVGSVGSTFQQAERYGTRVSQALNAIIDNKGNLRLRDEYGFPIKPGMLPENLDQFSQALDQTKQALFSKYDAMAKTAGQFIGVPLAPVVQKLQQLGQSNILNDFDKPIASYANTLAATLVRRGQYATEEAQAAIQHLNASLKAYYKNPTYETASRAGVDAMVAADLRAGLDHAVTSTVGAGYQDLKNQYGALRALENDVVKRATVVGRQEAGGGVMGRVGDVVSADEVIRGLLHFNLAGVATGAGVGAVTRFARYLRSPNRAVRRLFDAAEKRQTLQPSPTSEEIAAAIRTTAPVSGSVALQSVMP